MIKTLFTTMGLVASIFALTMCSGTSERKINAQMETIPVDSALDLLPNDGYAEELKPYSEELSRTMDEVIGYAPHGLKAYQPESPLSNWTADVLREAAIDYIGAPADVGVVNMGGLRCEIPAGDVTLRKMYELMPFDNQLTIVWLIGADLDSLCQGFAAYGGQGVSGLTFCISASRAHNICVQGQPLDPLATYSVATNDYLVAGNDGMESLTRHTKRVDTGMTIRDIYIKAVKQTTANGTDLMAELEGRLTFCAE